MEGSPSLRLFLLEVTGGTDDRPTRGVNLVIAGIPEGVEVAKRGYRFRLHQVAA